MKIPRSFPDITGNLGRGGVLCSEEAGLMKLWSNESFLGRVENSALRLEISAAALFASRLAEGTKVSRAFTCRARADQTLGAYFRNGFSGGVVKSNGVPSA